LYIKFGLSVFLNYPCIPSINPDNREYTVVPTVPFESPKGSREEKYLGLTNPLTWPCRRLSIDEEEKAKLLRSLRKYIVHMSMKTEF
jgi:hypothetical protein